MRLKNGYEDGVQTVEIYEGKVDVILYNNKRDISFYFYRFHSEEVFGEKLKRDVHLIYPHEVASFLEERGMDYHELIESLVNQAVESGMRERYDM